MAGWWRRPGVPIGRGSVADRSRSGSHNLSYQNQYLRGVMIVMIILSMMNMMIVVIGGVVRSDQTGEGSKSDQMT